MWWLLGFWVPPGPVSGPNAFGSCGAIHGPITPSTMKKPRITRPVSIFFDLAMRSLGRRLRGGAVATGVAGGTGSLETSTISIGSGLLTGARVERDVDDVRDEVRGEHDERD